MDVNRARNAKYELHNSDSEIRKSIGDVGSYNGIGMLFLHSDQLNCSICVIATTEPYPNNQYQEE